MPAAGHGMSSFRNIESFWPFFQIQFCIQGVFFGYVWLHDSSENYTA